MPKFKKTIDELENDFEKWLFLIKNISELDEIPEKLKEEKLLNAKKMLEKGIELSLVKEITGLSEDELELI